MNFQCILFSSAFDFFILFFLRKKRVNRTMLYKLKIFGILFQCLYWNNPRTLLFFHAAVECFFQFCLYFTLCCNIFCGGLYIFTIFKNLYVLLISFCLFFLKNILSVTGSPPGEYTQEVPPRHSSHGFSHSGPPILPPHLLQVILNKEIPVHVSDLIFLNNFISC